MTRTATTAVSVEVPPTAAGVTAPLTEYQPSEVYVLAGGTVTWTMAAVPHTVPFTGPGSPNPIGEMRDAAASRTFAAPGSFPYQCAIHANMRGTVYVH